jgi:hypothetical protein
VLLEREGEREGIRGLCESARMDRGIDRKVVAFDPLERR